MRFTIVLYLLPSPRAELNNWDHHSSLLVEEIKHFVRSKTGRVAVFYTRLRKLQKTQKFRLAYEIISMKLPGMMLITGASGAPGARRMFADGIFAIGASKNVRVASFNCFANDFNKTPEDDARNQGTRIAPSRILDTCL